MSRPVTRDEDDDFMSACRIAKKVNLATGTVVRMASIGRVRAKTKVIEVSLYSLADVRRELERRGERTGVLNAPETAGTTTK